MTDTDTRAGLDLAAIEESHRRVLNETYPEHPEYAYCHIDGQQWPCQVARLVAEVRRLRADNAEYRRSRSYWYVRAHAANAERVDMERRLVAVLAGLRDLPDDPPAPPHVAPEATQRGKEGREG